MALSQKFHKDRRTELGKKLKENAVAMIYSGREIGLSADAFYPFNVNNNFYYLTGINEAEIMLILYKNADGELKEALYLNEVDPLKEKWVGRKLRPNEAMRISGVTDIKTYEAMGDDIESLVLKSIYLDHKVATYQNYQIKDEKIKNCIQNLEISDLNPIFEKMRLIKTREEITAIQKANYMSKKAFKQMSSEIKPGVYEYELAACFEYCIKKWGAQGPAFESIVASGENATTLHYISNQARLKEGELVLFDLGARLNGYCGDISRTLPVSKNMTDEQAMYYEMVKEVQQEMFRSYKPEVSLKELQTKTMNLFEEKCRQKNCLPESGDIRDYYYHGIGHSLGLDTHDIRPEGDLILKPGMVMTVEPGIYVKKAGIGIRIEDDVVITESGCEVL